MKYILLLLHSDGWLACNPKGPFDTVDEAFEEADILSKSIEYIYSQVVPLEPGGFKEADQKDFGKREQRVIINPKDPGDKNWGTYGSESGFLYEIVDFPPGTKEEPWGNRCTK